MRNAVVSSATRPPEAGSARMVDLARDGGATLARREDYLLRRWFGMTFMIGGISMLLGLLYASCARLAASPDVDKFEGILLLANTAGVLFLSFSMGVAAAPLLLLAAYYVWFREKMHAGPHAA